MDRRLSPVRWGAVGVAAVLAAGAGMSGCAAATRSAPPVGPGGAVLHVVAAIAPLADLVANVGGQAVRVDTLVGPGVDAHTFDPTPRQGALVAGADLVVYLGGDLQPAVARMATSLARAGAAIDLHAALGGPRDPHVWLDPARMRRLAAVVRDELLRRAPGGPTGPVGTDIADRATRYDARLGALDDAFRATLASCRTRVLVTAHEAFDAWAKYGLEVIGVAGLSPEAEPSASDLERTVATLRQHRVTTVFVERGVPTGLATTLAREVGAATAVLDPMESLSREQAARGIGYVTVMTANLAVLRTGLGCGSAG